MNELHRILLVHLLSRNSDVLNFRAVNNNASRVFEIFLQNVFHPYYTKFANCGLPNSIHMTIKKHIPNTITLLNLFCGCIALVLHSTKILKWHFILFVWVFLDFFDGFFARLFHVSSPLGLQLDFFGRYGYQWCRV
jgi:hypothetical protein